MRASLLFGFFVLAFSVIAVRIVYWQVIVAENLRKEAGSQHYIELSLASARGQILDKDQHPIVLNQPSYLVYAEPRNIENKELFAEIIAANLMLDKQYIRTIIDDPTRVWAPLAHKVDSKIVETLRKLELAGIGFESEPKRFYPEASMAAHMLGFVGSDVNGTDKGYFGLEGFYDRQLKGTAGRLRIEKDAHGNPILIGEQERLEPVDGRSLVLWLDRAIQATAQKRLLEGIAKYGAKEGTVTIIDPQTGGILAMASYPNYDPGMFANFDKNLYTNPIVATTYEPGSTFKALVMAEAINKNLVTPNTIMDEDGPVKVGPYFIRTWNNQYNGKITMTQVLERSSNVGMVFIARKLGHDAMLSAIKKFGFGSSTNIDLEEEESPQLRADTDWHEIDDLTASFGQGIAVTPLQMVRAVASLANGGKLMEPHVVKEIKEAKGKVIPVKPKVIRQVLKPETTRIITEMMIAAVDHGEAKWAKPAGYRIAGKTGTAQIPVEGHYDESKTIASFVGFAPADSPRFVMLVTLREPISSPWGSETAAPLFFTIARDIFTYWGIPPQ